jgi:hypothetical protein
LKIFSVVILKPALNSKPGNESDSFPGFISINFYKFTIEYPAKIIENFIGFEIYCAGLLKTSILLFVL